MAKQENIETKASLFFDDLIKAGISFTTRVDRNKKTITFCCVKDGEKAKVCAREFTIKRDSLGQYYSELVLSYE